MVLTEFLLIFSYSVKCSKFNARKKSDKSSVFVYFWLLWQPLRISQVDMLPSHPVLKEGMEWGQPPPHSKSSGANRSYQFIRFNFIKALDHSNEMLHHSNETLDHSNRALDHSNGALYHSNGGLDHSNGLLDHSNGPLDHSNGALDHSNGPLTTLTGC